MTGRAALAIMTLMALMASRPARADPQDIEDGEPVTIEDAFTDPAGQLSLQYSGSWERVRRGGSEGLLEQGPTFKLGAMPGVQISVNPNYLSGNAQGHNGGFVLTDALIQLNRQGPLLPAFAVDVFRSEPFGAGFKTASWVVRGIASKWLGPDADAPRLHLNLTDTHVNQTEPGGRRDQLELAVGGSMRLGQQGAVVADLVHGAAEEAGVDRTILELGYSRDLPNDWSLQLGVGRQVAGRGDAVRIFFAIERELSIF